jgi:aminoacrylate hydrolase
VATFAAGDGAELFYRDEGEGRPPIVLVHGWQSTGSTWKAIAPLLSRSQRTIAVDLRGCGASANAPGPYTVEQFSEDVAALLRDVIAARAVVVGHSMGGAIAMRLAVDHPELPAGIVLVATVPPAGLQFPPHVDTVFRGTAGNIANFERWLRRQSLEPLAEPYFTALLEGAATITPEAALESYESWTKLDFADEVRKILTPTLVIPGDSDRPNLTPERLREHVLDLIPNARMAIVERSGHYVPLEQPEATAEAIRRFIAEIAC